MANEGRRPSTAEMREQRHETHKNQTWSEFVSELSKQLGRDKEGATRAAVSVLCHLERRLTSNETKDLESQLPMKLRELLKDSCRDRDAIHKMHKAEFVACVADDLGVPTTEAESVIRAVFTTVRARISEGEATDISAQLPMDLKPLWLQPA